MNCSECDTEMKNGTRTIIEVKEKQTPYKLIFNKSWLVEVFDILMCPDCGKSITK